MLDGQNLSDFKGRHLVLCCRPVEEGWCPAFGADVCSMHHVPGKLSPPPGTPQPELGMPPPFKQFHLPIEYTSEAISVNYLYRQMGTLFPSHTDATIDKGFNDMVEDKVTMDPDFLQEVDGTPVDLLAEADDLDVKVRYGHSSPMRILYVFLIAGVGKTTIQQCIYMTMCV